MRVHVLWKLASSLTVSVLTYSISILGFLAISVCGPEILSPMSFRLFLRVNRLGMGWVGGGGLAEVSLRSELAYDLFCLLHAVLVFMFYIFSQEIK